MPREFFLLKEPGARSDTFYQLPLLPADLKEKAESEAGAQMADQHPRAGEDTELQRFPGCFLGSSASQAGELKQLFAPGDL